MKSKVIITALSVATLLVGAAIFAMNTSTHGLFRTNVKALADATPVKTCYLVGLATLPLRKDLFCDENTTPDIIYTCPAESWNFASGTSLCTR